MGSTMLRGPPRGGEIERLGVILERVIASLRVRMEAAEDAGAEPERRPTQSPPQPFGTRSSADTWPVEDKPASAGV